jgi:hypothetical protein
MRTIVTSAKPALRNLNDTRWSITFTEFGQRGCVTPKLTVSANPTAHAALAARTIRREK